MSDIRSKFQALLKKSLHNETTPTPKGPLFPEDLSNDPLFNQADIAQSRNELDTILRLIFVEYGISRRTFSQLYHEYAINTLRQMPDKINDHVGNLIKALKKGKITFNYFKIIIRALGFSIKEMSFELIRNGTQINVHTPGKY